MRSVTPPAYFSLKMIDKHEICEHIVVVSISVLRDDLPDLRVIDLLIFSPYLF